MLTWMSFTSGVNSRRLKETNAARELGRVARLFAANTNSPGGPTAAPAKLLAFEKRHGAALQTSGGLLCQRVYDPRRNFCNNPKTLPNATGRSMRDWFTKTGFLLWLVLFLPLLFLSFGQRAVEAGEGWATAPELAARERTFVVGRVSENPKKVYPRLEKLAKYLARRLEPLGITAGGVLVAKDNREMISYLRHGDVDLVAESVLSSILYSEEAGAEILLREWRNGVPEYHSIFFAREDSGIKRLADLRGKKVAFEDRGSTSAFLWPLATLKREDLEPVELSSPREEPPSDGVGYAFAMSEENIVAWVALDLADAGALSNQDWDDTDSAPEALKEGLKIVHTSKAIIRALVLTRKGLRPEVKAQVKEILLNMHNEPDGVDVLRAYNRVKKYDVIEGEVAESLDEAHRVFALIRKELD